MNLDVDIPMEMDLAARKEAQKELTGLIEDIKKMEEVLHETKARRKFLIEFIERENEYRYAVRAKEPFELEERVIDVPFALPFKAKINELRVSFVLWYGPMEEPISFGGRGYKINSASVLRCTGKVEFCDMNGEKLGDDDEVDQVMIRFDGGGFVPKTRYIYTILAVS